MTESVRDRWLSIGMSVLLHGSLIALLALGWWHFRQQSQPAPSLPINATVVDARTLKGVGTASAPAPQPKSPPQTQPPVAPPAEGPPPPTPDEIAMRQAAAEEEAQHQAQAQQELLARQQAREQAREKEQAEAAAEQAAEAQKAEEAQAAADAQAKKAAAAKKLAEARKKAAAKLAAQKKLAEQQAADERAARVAQLRQSLQEDERATAASGALASWQSEVTSRIQNAWIKPPTAQAGIKCVLNVSLVPGGSVSGVSIGDCNGDDAVRQSIQTAVYNASPLPPPPDGIAFPRELIITFQPNN